MLHLISVCQLASFSPDSSFPFISVRAQLSLMTQHWKSQKRGKKCHSFGKILRTKCMCGGNEDHFPVRYFSIANYEIENGHYSTREAQNLVSQLRDRKVVCLQMGNHQKYGS